MSCCRKCQIRKDMKVCVENYDAILDIMLGLVYISDNADVDGFQVVSFKSTACNRNKISD